MPDDYRSLSPNSASQTGPALPERGFWRAQFIAILILLALMLISFSACATEARNIKERFTTTSDSNVRLTCLAELLKLPGQEPTVRELFNSLSQEDKLAIIKSSKPQDAAQELVPIVKVLYVDLLNDPEGNDLLRAMNGPLRDLDDPTAHSLSTEIDRWLDGRTSYGKGQEDAAVAAYTRAIEINAHNLGTFHDRALAYTRLGQYTNALNDLTETIGLNSNSDWKSRVQKALLSDQGLYNAVWNQKDKYPSLVEIVPTPTQTPVPTMTSIPSRTPTPTLTPTLVPPAHTSTPTPMATPAATPTPIVLRAVSPLYPVPCRNPVTFRWKGDLQLYQIYRVSVRCKSGDYGTVSLPGSPRLTDPIWQAQLPERVNVGGVNYTVYGEIEWQVLINDSRTGETVSRSNWFKFYFDPLNGQICP